MAEYLEPTYHNIKNSDAQLLFQLKTKMVPVKANYSSSFRENLNCILCGNEGRIKKDTQKHIMKCPVIRSVNPEQKEIHYKDLKSDIIAEQLNVVKRFRIFFEIRKTLIDTLNNTKRS